MLKKTIIACLISLCLLAPPAWPANYALEIIVPKASGTGSPAIPDTHRIFRAYPGIEYNIRPAVIGGSYPYAFELTAYPAGMTINSSTGEISWPNPITSGSPHSATIRVTDSEATQATATWEIAVSTIGFHFVQTGYTGTETGSIAQPFSSINNMLSGLSASNFSDIVYIRSGNYTLSEFGPQEGSYCDVSNGCVSIGQADESGAAEYRPFVWIGYPGETININMNDLFIRSTNMWFDSVNLSNASVYGLWVYGNTHYNSFRRSSFSDLNGVVATNANQGFFFYNNSGTDSYLVIQDSEFSYWTGAQGIGSLYYQNKFLIEDNYFHDGGYVGEHGFCTPIGVKDVCTNYTIRHNRIIMPAAATDFEFYNEFTSDDNAEFCFNYVYKTSGGNGRAFTFYYPIDFHVYRNTLVGNVVFRPALSVGPYYFDDNLLIGALIDATYVTQANNLIEASATGVIDANGLLINRDYVGTYGWELSDTPASTHNSVCYGCRIMR